MKLALIFFLAMGAQAAGSRRRRLTSKDNAFEKAEHKIVVKNAKALTSNECQQEFSAENVEDLCTLWEVFDNMGRAENNNPGILGFEWTDLCDDFAPFNQWLCPSEYVVQQGICTHDRPWLNPAIRVHYCRPLLDSMPNGPRRDACETWCTNYVSQARGHCCDFECLIP